MSRQIFEFHVLYCHESKMNDHATDLQKVGWEICGQCVCRILDNNSVFIVIPFRRLKTID